MQNTVLNFRISCDDIYWLHLRGFFGLKVLLYRSLDKRADLGPREMIRGLEELKELTVGLGRPNGGRDVDEKIYAEIST